MTKEQLETYKNTYDRYDGIPNNEFDSICDELINYKQLEEQIGCPLEEIVEFIRLLKKTYYIDSVTGRLDERWSPYESNEKELCKINSIFYKIKDKSE